MEPTGDPWQRCARLEEACGFLLAQLEERDKRIERLEIELGVCRERHTVVSFDNGLYIAENHKLEAQRDAWKAAAEAWNAIKSVKWPDDHAAAFNKARALHQAAREAE